MSRGPKISDTADNPHDAAADDENPGKPAVPGISNRLTFLLYRAVAALVDATAPYYRSFGLSIPAARAMVSLAENGGAITVGRLSEVTGIDLSTISHLLRRIERLGYVARARDDEDNRVVVITLTPAGAGIARDCRNASLYHEEVLLNGIGHDQAVLLKQLLHTMNENCHLISATAGGGPANGPAPSR